MYPQAPSSVSVLPVSANSFDIWSKGICFPFSPPNSKVPKNEGHSQQEVFPWLSYFSLVER